MTQSQKQTDFPRFDLEFGEIDRFIQTLVRDYKGGKLDSWDGLDVRVKLFFSQERMDSMDARLDGWNKMASYTDGITLTHIMCVFLGLYMLPEFELLSPAQQQITKWIVLLHDIDKVHIPGQKDAMHAFRSGAAAANILPSLGFPVNHEYPERIKSWSDLVVNAYTLDAPGSPWKPDNQKLPRILEGIDHLMGKDAPGCLIVKTVLLHISLSVDPFYPTPSPLTDEEIKQSINTDLFPFLKNMMLADNEGWSLFEPETRARQRKDALEAFTKVESMIKDGSNDR